MRVLDAIGDLNALWKASGYGRILRRALAGGVLTAISISIAELSITPATLTTSVLVAILLAVDKYIREKLEEKKKK